MMDAAGGVLFPTTCPSCRQQITHHPDWPLCQYCRTRIEAFGESICTQCGMPAFGDSLCTNCLEGRTPKPAITVRSAARYAGPVKDAILAAKRGGREDIADWLGRPLKKQFEGFDLDPANAVIVPVPLHRRRMAELGFSLPDSMSRRLALECGMAYRPFWISRIVDTPSQVGRDWDERYENVKRAFSTEEKHFPETITAVLIDDVATSGATMACAAKPLIDKGVNVVGITLARAI